MLRVTHPVDNVEKHLPYDEGIHLGPEYDFRNADLLVQYNGNERRGWGFLGVGYGGWKVVSLDFVIYLDREAVSQGFV